MFQNLNKSLLLTIGVVAFAVALIYQAPASMLNQILVTRSEGILLLTDEEGTVWSGQASLTISSELGQENIGHLAWETFPSKLLLGKLPIQLTWNQSPPSILTLSPNEVRVKDFSFEVPGSAVTHFVPTLNAAQLGGQLHITTRDMLISKGTMYGVVRFEWKGVTSPLSQVNPLGEYELLLRGNGGVLNLQLTTLNGPLILEGTGDWSLQSGLGFLGYANTDETHQSDLLPLLHIIGNKKNDNESKFMINIKL